MGGSLSARLTLWRLPRYFVVVTAVLLIVIGGGGYLAAHRGAKRLLEPLRWFGIVQYESMSVGLGGGVEFDNLVVSRVSNGKPEDLLRAAKVHVDTPGLLWLILAARYGAPNTDKSALAGFMAAAKPFGDTLPASFPELDSLRVSLRQPVIGQALRDFYDLQWFGLDVAAPFPTEGCGLARFAPADLKAMRLPESGLEVDLDFAVTGPDQARIGIGFNVPESSRATLDMRLRWSAPERLLDANWDQVVLLERTWQVQDAGFVLARNRFCARKLGVPRDAFADQHIEAIETRLGEFGAIPQLEVLNAYRRYLSRGGEIRWHSQPSPAMAMGQFSRFRPPEQVRILNATVETLKGNAVRFGFDFVQPAPVAAPLDSVAQATPTDPATTAPTTPPADGAVAPPVTTTVATTAAPVTTTVASVTPPVTTTVASTTPIINAAGTTITSPPPATTSASLTPPKPATVAPPPVANPVAATPPRPVATPPNRGKVPIDPLAASPATTPPLAATRPAPTPATTTTTPAPVTSGDTTLATNKSYATNAPPLAPVAPPRPVGPLRYEDLARYEGHRVVIRSRYNSIRTGTLLKYTDAALTLRLEGRQAGLELSMPRQTVRDVIAAGN